MSVVVVSIPPKQQSGRAQFIILQRHLDQGWAEFTVTFPASFDDANYSFHPSFSHRSITGTEAGKNAYVYCGWRDKEKNLCMFVIGVHKELGAVVNDPIEIDWQAIHD